MCVVTKEKNKELYNSLFPEDVETITMTKKDYDRNIEQLLVEKLELEHKYNLMKKNAYQLAMKIDKAINILELSSQNKGICTQIGTDTIQSVLSILKGEDKE